MQLPFSILTMLLARATIPPDMKDLGRGLVDAAHGAVTKQIAEAAGEAVKGKVHGSDNPHPARRIVGEVIATATAVALTELSHHFWNRFTRRDKPQQ